MRIDTKLKKLSKKRATVAFTVKTPHTSTGRPVRSVQMRDFTVKETKDGRKMVVGRVLEEEELAAAGDSRRCYSARNKKQMRIRHYDISNIVRGTLIGSKA